MTDIPNLRPESVRRLGDLEKSTGSLATQLETLTRALEELANLRQQAEHTNTQAELAVVTSLDATNEIAGLTPQIRELRSKSVTRAELRRRAFTLAAWGIGGILLLSYVVVTGQQVFSKHCQFPDYLTESQAEVCNQVFIGDREYLPGVQTTNKIYAPVQGEQNNG